ncbi:MAG: iron ABC transporter permease [Lachnospira sp.]|nr:iron ABC transporter permease [Lachnospira sp.]
MVKTKICKKTIIIFVAFLLVVLSLLGLIYGSVKIPLKDVLEVLTLKDKGSKVAIIIWSVRLPRVIGAILAGAGLAVSGVILQSVMNNALASPNTIGVNSGAGFFVMLSMMLAPNNLFLKPVMAFLGAFITSLVILSLAYVAEKSRITIILAGVTISSFLSAGMSMIKILDSDINVNATNFLVGSLSGVTMNSLILPAIGIVIAIIITILLSKGLNILALGDGVACSIGLPVNIFRILFVIIASFLAGLVVSFAGLIGFVGLIVPHIARNIFGNDARVLIPSSMLIGAVLVLGADLLGRVIFSPYELAVGILLSLAGGPFFMYLLMRKGGRRLNA